MRTEPITFHVTRGTSAPALRESRLPISEVALPRASKGSGCPLSPMRAGLAEPDEGHGLPEALRDTHAALRRLLGEFSLADAASERALRVQLQRLARALGHAPDSTGTSHYLAGAGLFQLQAYEAAVAQLIAACAAQPERDAWRLLLERAQASATNGVGLRRPPVELFRPEELLYPAALALRAPEGVCLPPAPAPRERLAWGARELASRLSSPLVRGLFRLAGQLGPKQVWRLQEELANAVAGKHTRTPGAHVKALLAELWFGPLCAQLNLDVVQDPYLGDLAGHAPPGQRRPEWTRYFPTADGSWRTDDPNLGKAGTRFPQQGRLEVSEIARNRALDPGLPNPRLVSRALLAPEGPRKQTPFLNLLAAAWLQFQVHGFFQHRQLPPQAGVLRYPLDEADPIRLATGQTHLEFRKTQPDVLQGRGPEYFQSEVTHWWDASQLYGSDQATEDRLRTGPDGQLLRHGKLYLTERGCLPLDPELGVEDTGFNRNWWVGLSLLHTLFAREHNAVCDALRAQHPGWSSDHVYKAARLEVAAKMARIHTVEWTPAVMPKRALESGLHTRWHGLVASKLMPFEQRRARAWWTPQDAVLGANSAGQRQFSEDVSEVYRLHAAVPDELCLCGVRGPSRAPVPIELTRERCAHELVAQLGLETLAATFGHQHMPSVVENNYPHFMFDTSTDGQAKIDIGAADIVRARERGIPAYNQFRAQLGRPRCLGYADITKHPKKIAKLAAVYGPEGIEKVDLQVGLLFEDGAERPFQGFDDTRLLVFLHEASRRLEADPFYTDKWNDPRVYTAAMKQRISETTLHGLLLRHLPGLAHSGLMGVGNAFEPWGSDVHTAPEEHPLAAAEQRYARASRRRWRRR